VDQVLAYRQKRPVVAGDVWGVGARHNRTEPDQPRALDAHRSVVVTGGLRNRLVRPFSQGGVLLDRLSGRRPSGFRRRWVAACAFAAALVAGGFPIGRWEIIVEAFGHEFYRST
jgi:hypothetical protein